MIILIGVSILTACVLAISLLVFKITKEGPRPIEEPVVTSSSYSTIQIIDKIYESWKTRDRIEIGRVSKIILTSYGDLEGINFHKSESSIDVVLAGNVFSYLPSIAGTEMPWINITGDTK